MGVYFRSLPQEIIAGVYCGSLLWEVTMGVYHRSLPWEITAGVYCGLGWIRSIPIGCVGEHSLFTIGCP